MDINFVREYLTGEKFDRGLITPYKRKMYPAKNRRYYLEPICRNKKIIHVGFVAHSEVVDRRIETGDWVHAQLMEWSTRCLGLDIDQKGVDYLKDIHGVTDAVCSDITGGIIPEIANENWDYAFLGDVLEHVPNPVMFLEGFKKYNNINRLIISVPNLFRRDLFDNAFEYFERVNSDHLYGFTAYNLCKTITSAGYYPEDMVYCEPIGKLPAYQKWKRSLYKRIGMDLNLPYFYFKTQMVIVKNANQVCDDMKF